MDLKGEVSWGGGGGRGRWGLFVKNRVGRKMVKGREKESESGGHFNGCIFRQADWVSGLSCPDVKV